MMPDRTIRVFISSTFRDIVLVTVNTKFWASFFIDYADFDWGSAPNPGVFLGMALSDTNR
ncbi:hypothetical protein J3R75_002619 [Oligosphaera ethanolica]|uniref:Uncharacterized protein n=1 Tax=Oligosphaera ethanolica TaxID=760260 RepID=A0AAE3VH68_9BACT|nr:hypothetical protein [Oligosphaera ethanolica]